MYSQVYSMACTQCDVVSMTETCTLVCMAQNAVLTQQEVCAQTMNVFSQVNQSLIKNYALILV